MKNFLTRYSATFYTALPHVAVIAVICFLLQVVWQSRLAYSDFPPFKNNYRDSLSDFWYAWSDHALGGVDLQSGSYIVRAATEFVSLGDPVIAQGIYIVGLFVIAYYGVRQLLLQLHLSKDICFIVPFFYLFNPVTASELSNGAVGLLLPYALYPAVVLCLYRSFFKPSTINTIYLGFGLIFFTLNLQTGFWMLILPGLFLLALAIKDLPFLDVIKRSSAIIFAVFIALCINFTAVFNLAFVSQNYQAVEYLDTFRHTYGEASPENFFRLAGNSGSSQTTLGYFDASFSNVMGYVSFLIVVLTLFYVRSSNQFPLIAKRLLVVAWLSFLTSIGFLFLISQGFFDSLITDKNLLLVSLRNPQKLLYIQVLSFVLLLGFGLEYLRQIIVSNSNEYKKRIYVFTLVAVSLSWTIYNHHFLSGDFGLFETKGEGHAITSSYEEIEQILISYSDQGSALVLPFDYSTQLKLASVDSLVTAQLGGAMSASSTIPAVLSEVYQRICSGDDVTGVLKQLGVSHVLIDLTPQSYLNDDNFDASCQQISSYGTPYIWGSSKYLASYFADLPVVSASDEYILFELRQEKKSDISVFTDLAHVQGAFSSAAMTNFLLENEIAQNYVIDDLTDIPTSVVVAQIFADPSLYYLNFENNQISVELQSFSDGVGQIYWQRETPYALENLSGSYDFLANVGQTQLIELEAETAEYVYSFGDAEILNNVVTNGDFENGLWRASVSNCKEYDDDSNITMSKISSAYRGTSALLLSAQRHTACTHQIVRNLNPAEYTLSYAVNGEGGKGGHYFGSSQDENFVQFASHLGVGEWEQKSFQFVVPEAVSAGTLYLYAHEPLGIVGENVQVYDEVSLYQTPAAFDESFFLVTERKEITSDAPKITVETEQPTQRSFSIHGATENFYLSMNESYHPQWQLQFVNEKNSGFWNSWQPFVEPDTVSEQAHFRVNSFLNGWYIDVAQYCVQDQLCRQNSDGTYDLSLVVEFVPQRWFYLGFLISVVTLLGGVGYVVFDWRRRRKRQTT